MGGFRRVFSNNNDTTCNNYITNKKKQIIHPICIKTPACHVSFPNKPMNLLEALVTYYINIDFLNSTSCCIFYDRLLENVYIKLVLQYIQDYIDGNNEALKQELTFENVGFVLSQLELLRDDDLSDTNYNNLITYFMNALTVIQNGLLLNNQLTATNQALGECQERSQILNDIDALKQYLASLEMTNTLLPHQTVQATFATIHPEYLIYITQYGFPENKIFNPTLLADIINSLH